MPECICAFSIMKVSGNNLAFHILKSIFNFLLSSANQLQEYLLCDIKLLLLYLPFEEIVNIVCCKYCLITAKWIIFKQLEVNKITILQRHSLLICDLVM